MELGSEEHRKLLQKGIFKTSQRISSLGLFIGALLILPYFIRDNAFSTGLLYVGIGIAITAILYSFYLAYRKYQKIMVPFNEQYQKKN